MTVLDRMATALNRRDEGPNQELARDIVRTHDTGAVRELVENLANSNRNIQSDCIKALDEIGTLAPEMIAGYYKELGKLLDSSNNRMIWGAMAALDTIALHQPKGVHSLLAKIITAADTGSVITRDHAVGILAKLGTLKQYAPDCIPPLIRQLATSPGNQFPMYAEMALAVITDSNRETFREIITERFDGLEKESQRKRVGKVLKKIGNKGGEIP